MKETILYGCKINDTDNMEEILHAQKGYVNKEKLLIAYQNWAKDNGYNRLRLIEVPTS